MHKALRNSVDKIKYYTLEGTFLKDLSEQGEL